jgi:multiple sugar transport system substrate-binding protein
MSIELEFSVISTSKNQLALLQKQLADFERQTHVHVHLQVLQWATARAELVKYGLYRSGADVSEAGSTWISDFIGMNVLRPFTMQEAEQLGGRDSFVSAAWKAGCTIEEEQQVVWAIPWMVSPVLIAYRADWLERAGVDPSRGFVSFDSFEQTLEKLQAIGCPFPLTLPVHNSRYGTLHNVASWIWGAGSDFLAENGSRVIFDEPKSLAGITRYYGLRRYFGENLAKLLIQEQKQLRSGLEFWKGNAAITVSGSWLLADTLMTPEVRQNVAIASLPASAFVGAQSMVVWRHSRQPAAALDLIGYLTQPDVLAEYAEELGLLPARNSVLDNGKNPSSAILAQIVRNGRSFPAARLLGLVEDKLSLAMENLWDEILQPGIEDASALIEKRLCAVARQLNLTLSS